MYLINFEAYQIMIVLAFMIVLVLVVDERRKYKERAAVCRAIGEAIEQISKERKWDSSTNYMCSVLERKLETVAGWKAFVDSIR